ncbi:S1C family serine protease [Aquibacillus albus]|uniref:Serine protease Do n=1 Tax=Aquibacillus albus TaxID=1168171 RepID=A0ABS2MYW1_9BACI|nr:S1C family serine protease [Aquibacillus albus]MBM7571108.1 serine protease Do [Aquibacillus albus]
MTYHDNQHNYHSTEENAFEKNNTEVSSERHQENQTITQQPQTRNNQQKQINKLALFISGLTGGLVVAAVGCLLLFTGMLPTQVENTSQPESEPVSGTGENNTTQSETIIPTATSQNYGNTLTSTLEKVSDAVVGVANIQQAGLWTEAREAGAGSGVIYKKENGKAYVVTNNHVVEGASEVEVILANGEKVPAEVLGADELSDLAVLEMDGSKVNQVATLGSSSELSVGDTAIAIGNPLGTEFAGSVTKGIISGLERSVEMDLNRDGQADWTTEVIQTDAAINPGNSGGALINSRGEVVGINSMKIAQANVEGIGFAIPIDEAKPIIDQLETNGEVARPFMGISAVGLSTVPEVNKRQTLKLGDEVDNGVVIAEVQSNSPANQAGLQRYDVITTLNGKEISSMIDLRQILYSEVNIGDQVDVTYYREGEKQTTSITLGEQG